MCLHQINTPDKKGGNVSMISPVDGVVVILHDLMQSVESQFRLQQREGMTYRDCDICVSIKSVKPR